MDWQTDGAAGVGYAAGDGLANPPGGIGGEFETFTPVELFYGVHEADVAFLDEVKQRQTRGVVLLGNGHHETQVGLHELTFSARTEALNFAQFALAGCTMRVDFSSCFSAALPSSISFARRTSSSLVSKTYWPMSVR